MSGFLWFMARAVPLSLALVAIVDHVEPKNLAVGLAFLVGAIWMALPSRLIPENRDE